MSDSKMDISETNTSQDSPCYSPDVEECDLGYSSRRGGGDGHSSSNDIIYSAESIAAPSNANHSGNSELKEYLDNHSSGPTLNVKTANPRGPNSGLTPVSSHPLMLMSPTGSESDSSELANLASKNHEKVRNYYHFPDVVPASEQPPLRLANPYPNRTGTTTTTRSTTTSTTRTTTSTLDVINNIDNANNIKKTGLLRDASPDFLSSGSEQDLSQFQASVTPTFQSVALVQSQSGSQLQQQQSFEHKSISPRLHERRKIPLSTDLLVDDISSLEETVSNHSVDDLQQKVVQNAFQAIRESNCTSLCSL